MRVPRVYDTLMYLSLPFTFLIIVFSSSFVPLRARQREILRRSAVTIPTFRNRWRNLAHGVTSRSSNTHPWRKSPTTATSIRFFWFVKPSSHLITTSIIETHSTAPHTCPTESNSSLSLFTHARTTVDTVKHRAESLSRPSWFQL